MADFKVTISMEAPNKKAVEDWLEKVSCPKWLEFWNYKVEADGDKKLCRIRYDDGEESGKEQYILEKYNWDTGDWGFIISVPFVISAEYPKAGKEFVHYTILTEAMKWVDLGYTVRL